MNNLILFFNEFISYILVFAIFIVTMIVAGTIGIKARKSKNEKEVTK